MQSATVVRLGCGSESFLLWLTWLYKKGCLDCSEITDSRSINYKEHTTVVLSIEFDNGQLYMETQGEEVIRVNVFSVYISHVQAEYLLNRVSYII